MRFFRRRTSAVEVANPVEPIPPTPPTPGEPGSSASPPPSPKFKVDFTSTTTTQTILTVEWKVDRLQDLLGTKDAPKRQGKRTSPDIYGGRWKLVVKLKPLEEDEKDPQIGVFLLATRSPEEVVGGKWTRREEVDFSIAIARRNGIVLLAKQNTTNSTWTDAEPDWGWATAMPRSAYFANSKLVDEDAVVVKCTLTFSHIVSQGDTAMKLQALNASLFCSSPTERSSYFRSMFSSGFKEALVNLDSPAMSGETVATDEADDDDDVDWLPAEWVTKCAPALSSPSTVSPTPNYGAIEVTDFAYVTYRAMLYYLYTDKIPFTPLASDFAVAVLEGRLEANPPSRRAYLLQRSEDGDGVVEPASPHAVYRLADKLDLPELKEKAKEAISRGLTVENVLYELFSAMSHQHNEIRQTALSYAAKHWDCVKATPAFMRVLVGARDIEGGEDTLHSLLQGTSMRKS
ncbi:hypothetical protein JCM8097_001564 [Rhodosporidiobolus ruineniae]